MAERTRLERRERTFCTVLISLLACPLLSAAAASQDPLACAQQAVGGQVGAPFATLELEGAILVKTATAPQDPRPLLVRFLLPDHYVRSEITRTGDGEIQRIRGFIGSRLLNAVKVSNPEKQQFGGTWGPERLPVERRAAAQMLLGLTGWPAPGVTLQSPSVAARGVTTLAVRIVDREVRLKLGDDCVPLAVSSQAQVRLPPPAGSRAMPPPVDAEVRVLFEDRRRSQGLLLPHRITTTANGVMLNQITVSRYHVNPGFSAEDFEQLNWRPRRQP